MKRDNWFKKERWDYYDEYGNYGGRLSIKDIVFLIGLLIVVFGPILAIIVTGTQR